MQPIVATLILMVAGRGIAQLITEGVIVTFVEPGLIFFGTGSFLGLPMPVIIAAMLGREVHPLEKRVAVQTFGVPDHLRGWPVTGEVAEVAAR